MATTSPGDLEGIDRSSLSGATKLSLFGDTIKATVHTGYTVRYGTGQSERGASLHAEETKRQTKTRIDCPRPSNKEQCMRGTVRYVMHRRHVKEARLAATGKQRTSQKEMRPPCLLQITLYCFLFPSCSLLRLLLCSSSVTLLSRALSLCCLAACACAGCLSIESSQNPRAYTMSPLAARRRGRPAAFSSTRS